MVHDLSNENTKRRLDFHKKISNFDAKLYKPGIENKFADDGQKGSFTEKRIEFSKYVQCVERDIATILLNQLEANSVEFENGIDKLDQEITSIDNTIGFLDLFGRVLNTIGRIVRLV
ncbi:MAG: hypothetical protein KME21_03550 [Desmonostoc vinosum HA7617-LM4]|jgi:hypothetical protein|nr:hypothetical protein [Desmonostoc vinosum HA7617-LM4]